MAQRKCANLLFSLVTIASYQRVSLSFFADTILSSRNGRQCNNQSILETLKNSQAPRKAWKWWATAAPTIIPLANAAGVKVEKSSFPFKWADEMFYFHITRNRGKKKMGPQLNDTWSRQTFQILTPAFISAFRHLKYGPSPEYKTYSHNKTDCNTITATKNTERQC